MIDTFSGIGGFSLAARWLGGIETVQFVEREPYCQRILRKHWPDVPIHDDICTFNPAPGSADIVCGGFPCQDISTAGKQAGIKEGTRSGLFYELMRVVRLVGPRYVVLENVAAITSNGLDAVLGTLAEAGFDAEWACIPAADVGACHRRDRWWCVAYASGARHGVSEGCVIGGIQANAESSGKGSDAPYPQSRRRRTGPGQGTNQAGYQGSGAGNGGAGSDAADTTHLLSDGQQVRHAGESGVRAVSEFGDGCGTGDAPHPHRQRQQERQPAAIAGGTEWTGWGDAPQRLNPDWRSYLSEPVLCRGDDGLSGRVDRLKALGNAVVPQVAMVPLARVLRLERLRSASAANPAGDCFQQREQSGAVR
jgi:DNA (cytosine-5)-methyltransferase 1